MTRFDTAPEFAYLTTKLDVACHELDQLNCFGTSYQLFLVGSSRNGQLVPYRFVVAYCAELRM